MISAMSNDGSQDVPDVHSFPTRRSSDLPAPWRGQMKRPWFKRLAAHHTPKPSCTSSLMRVPRALANRRSEEHTSELQSHSDLVCRLLLEKKKRRGCEVVEDETARAGVEP